MSIVGVVGAGVMGQGVAHAAAEAEHEVVLVDVSAEALAAARAGVYRSTRLRSLMSQVRVSPDEILARIRFDTDYGALSDAETIVENVTEDLDAKQQAHRSIGAVCHAATVVACNTSAIPIAVLAGWDPRPERVIGIHFMNPVPLKQTVELILSQRTTAATEEAAKRFLASIGKRAIVVADSPGFVSNRVLMAMINEASRIVDEGVAPVADVDAIFKECFGHAMGPLETADLIGLDTIVRSLEILRGYWDDARFQASPILHRMVDAGRLGQKSGEGFYDYGDTAGGG